MRSCRGPEKSAIYFWLSGGVRRRPQRVTSAGSGSRRDTMRRLRPAPLLLLLPPPPQQPVLLRLLLVLLYSQFGEQRLIIIN